MDKPDRTSKYCDKEGDDKSACLVRMDRPKEYNAKTCRQVEEICGSSSLIGGGDGITEMIHGIANSIKFDDVLEELRERFSKTVENNEGSNKVSDALPDYGSSPAPTKEVAEPICATDKNDNAQQITNTVQAFSAATPKQIRVTGGNNDSQQITSRFRDVPAEMIDRSCKELQTYLSEAAQNTTEEHRPKVHKNLAQATDNTTSRQITTIMLEDVTKENINSSCEVIKIALSETAEKTVKENSLKLREEFAKDVYADMFNGSNKLLGYLTDSFHKAVLGFGKGVVKRLEVGFHRVVQKFGNGLVRELVNWYDDGLVEDAADLKAELEEEIRKLTKDSELTLTSLCEMEINGYGYHLRSAILSDFEKRVQVHERLSATKDFNVKNELNLGSDEVQNELNAVEKSKDGSMVPHSESLLISMEEKNNKYKKHPLKKMWNNIKKFFCFCGAESSS